MRLRELISEVIYKDEILSVRDEMFDYTHDLVMKFLAENNFKNLGPRFQGTWQPAVKLTNDEYGNQYGLLILLQMKDKENLSIDLVMEFEKITVFHDEHKFTAYQTNWVNKDNTAKFSAKEFYVHMINTLDMPIVSDSVHFVGGRQLWEKLATDPRIDVFAYDTKKEKLHQLDPEEMSAGSFDVYDDPHMRNLLRIKRRELDFDEFEKEYGEESRLSNKESASLIVALPK